MKEIWRAVVGYEDYYEISNFGQVKSLARIDSRGERVHERILKPAKAGNGYLYVSLYKNGKAKNLSVHRLVGMVFADLVDWTEDAKGRPFEELTINHLNENKSVNLVGNLQWCPLERNIKYGTGIERRAKARSKPVVQKTKDGEFVREWPSAAEVQRQTGWSQGNISQCCNGIRKSAYGFKWSYSKV